MHILKSHHYAFSEEELAGSYNWDYLLDWGPQYQPLAHVFKEISKLRDDEDDESSGTGLNGSTNLRIAPQSNVSFMRYVYTSTILLLLLLKYGRSRWRFLYFNKWVNMLLFL